LHYDPKMGFHFVAVYATRKLTWADIQEQIAAKLLQEQEAARQGTLCLGQG
jgi:hypothetical protein